MKDRWHGGLAGERVTAWNGRMLAFELAQRLRRRRGWEVTIARNRVFQRLVAADLERFDPGPGEVVLFSYSYAARELFRVARRRGWRTVLGQIDPGPEEERIVAAERERYAHLASSWQPAPASYWDEWREEVELADEVMVNSEWSRRCLRKEGVADDKLRVVPLVYEEPRCAVEDAAGASGGHAPCRTPGAIAEAASLRVLFLGQINLRKGVGRLLDAMRLLRDEPIELVLAGPTQIPPGAWADLPRVRWVGPVPRSEVGGHYAAADCFILPTLSDGYALTQLEALARGLPVIASKHCGEAVTHGRNGWILEDLEPATIAEMLRGLRQRGTALPEVVPPRFSLEELGRSFAAR